MTTTTTLHRLAADYLTRLDRAARALPRGERRELVEEISAHLAEATDPDMPDVEVLTVLDRLGDPDEIVEAQQADEPQAPRRRGLHEWSAILLLLLGGFVFFVGWIGGAVLLWSSPAWKTRDKLIGTFIVPGGLATAVIVPLLGASKEKCVSLNGGLPQCAGGPSTLQTIVVSCLLAFCVLGPLCTSVYLARRAR